MSDDRIWMFRLGGPNQYRNVPYVEQTSGAIRCLLCRTGGMPPNNAGQHFNGKQHLTSHARIQAMEKEEKQREAREQFTRSLQSRVSKLGLPVWRWEVKAALHDYLIGNVSGNVYVMHTLEKYETREKLSLLELAIWKCKICDGVTFSSVQEMREYKVLDQDFDPLRFGQEMRLSSGSNVIVSLVAAFLPPPVYKYTAELLKQYEP